MLISGSLPVKFPTISEIFIAFKFLSWNFSGSLGSYFWVIAIISAIVGFSSILAFNWQLEW